VSVIAIPAMFFLSIRPGFTKLSDHLGNNLLQMWANFDGFHYLDQATTNYFPVGETSLTTAYFPVYPWLVRNLNDFVHNPLITGLIISNLAFFLSLLLLYKLFLLDYKEKISRFALLLIFLFPTSFIFGSI
jgi:Gpi18-like mannosyltransferase